MARQPKGWAFSRPGRWRRRSYTTLFNGRMGLLTTVSVGGRQIPVVNTHLAHGSGARPRRPAHAAARPPARVDARASRRRPHRPDGGLQPPARCGRSTHAFVPRASAMPGKMRWPPAPRAGAGRHHQGQLADRLHLLHPRRRLELRWIDNVDTRALTGTAGIRPQSPGRRLRRPLSPSFFLLPSAFFLFCVRMERCTRRSDRAS
jgi:hypothetical protein